MSPQTDFSAIFEKLREILIPYGPKLTVKAATHDSYHIDGPYSEKWKKELFFAATHIKKGYISFYLMPLYMYPDLLKGISPELKKHMQGKSCFNFKKIEAQLFQELAVLTQKGYERFQKEEYAG